MDDDGDDDEEDEEDDDDDDAATNLNRLTSHSTAFSAGFKSSRPPTRPRKSSRRVLS